MGNKTHALEETSYEANELIDIMVWMATRDGEVCPRERRAIELAHGVRDDVRGEIAKDNFIALVTKGIDVTRYANQLAAPLGFRLVALEEDRGKVVSLFPKHDTAG